MRTRASLSRTIRHCGLASLVCFGIALVLTIGTVSAEAAQNLVKVKVDNLADRVQITVTGDQPIACTRRQGVSFVAADIPGTAVPKARRFRVMSGHIWQARYGPFSSNPPVVRVAVSTKSARPYETWFSDDKREMVLKVYKRGYPKPAQDEKRSATKSESVSAVRGSPDRSAETSSSSVETLTTKPRARVGTEGLPNGLQMPAQARVVEPPKAKGSSKPVVKPLAKELEVAPKAVEPLKVVASLPVSRTNEPQTAAAVETTKPAPQGSDDGRPAVLRAAPSTSRAAADAWKRIVPTTTAPACNSTPGRPALVQRQAALPSTLSIPPPEPRNISLDFVAADINEVLKALAIQSGRNIVSSKDVAGQVTVSLNKVAFAEALDYVTKLSGYRYAQSGNTYVVGTASGLSTLLGHGGEMAGTKTEVVTIRYADAEEISKAIGQQVPGVKCSAGAYSSGDGKKGQQLAKVVMVSGSSEDVELAKDVIAKVEESLGEKRADHVTEIYQIKYADADSLADLTTKLYPEVTVTRGPTDGFDLTAPAGTPIGSASGGASQAAASGSTGGKKEEAGRTSLLLLSGPQADVQAALGTLEKVDRRPTQILIESKVTDLRVSAQKRLGLSWNWSSFGLLQRVGNVDAMQQPVDVRGKLTHTPVTIAATLDAMMTSGDATLLASPRVAAVEGKPAVIFIGDEIRYVINIQQTQQGQNITTETANVGIQLRVIADVSPDESITLNLHPEVSMVSEYITIGQAAGGTSIVLPQIARRYTDSVVRVKNGEMIVIGGLIRDQDLQSLRKVPFLGDIPFFGELFKRREKSKEHSEIVIFITCSILED